MPPSPAHNPQLSLQSQLLLSNPQKTTHNSTFFREITAIPELLGCLTIRERIITTDAMGIQRENVKKDGRKSEKNFIEEYIHTLVALSPAESSCLPPTHMLY